MGCSEFLDSGYAMSAHCEMNRTRRKGITETAGAECNLFQSGIVGQHGDDDFTPLASTGDGGRDVRPRFGGVRGFFERPVVNDQIMACAENSACNSPPHLAQTDETNPHDLPRRKRRSPAMRANKI
jgi:hypothetical protein